ncbi:MAG: DUF1800 domain-containing protein [Isosphaeraceae bacterium]
MRNRTMNESPRSDHADPRSAWAPYRPGADSPWDAARVAHLHRRAGLGANWGQVERDVREGFEPSIRRILEGEPIGPGGQPAADFEATVAAMEDSALRRPSIERMQMLWIYRLVFTPHPLREVMTLAWHGHYATSNEKVQIPELMLAQNQAQRELWRAQMGQLHRRMLSDGAMRRWLDGLNSTREHPNENLAREFLELFALGAGHYTERDVRDAARALTGWREADMQTHEVRLDPGDFDDGSKTILGETGRWGLDDLVRIACRHPEAAAHIARRLYRTFISDTDEPAPELIAPLADAMRIDGDVDVARGLETVLRSRLFHSQSIRTRRIKSPVNLAIGAIRALELFDPPVDPVDLEIHLTRTGERLSYPPSVAGWPGGMAWLDGQAIVARANFAVWITEPSTWGGRDAIAAVAERRGLKTPDAWLDAMATLLLPAPLSPESREVCSVRPSDRRITTRRLLSLPEAQVG